MTAKGMRRRIVSLLAGAVVVGAVVVGAVVAGAVLVADRSRPDPPPGDVRNIVAAYLADENAAREEYRDALVTASGVVNWSKRREEITSRISPRNGAKQLARPDDIPDEVCVLITVLGRHQVLANFDGENKREALLLKTGDRVTIKGRHTGSWFGAAVYRGETVYLTLVDCELVR
jgi:hypothetical protein